MRNQNIYLIARYVALPKDPKQTSKAGYMTNPDNIRYDEQLTIARGMKDKYLKNQVVLDLTEEKIVKNSFKSGSSFEELFGHYLDAYNSYITESIDKLNGTTPVKS